MHLFLFSLLLAAAARSVLPEQWVIPDEAELDEYFDDLREDELWPLAQGEYVGLVLEDQNSLNAPKQHMVEEDPDPKEFPMWKLALVGTILLMTVLGSLSLAYYMCVWRAGRVDYDLQKDVSV